MVTGSLYCHPLYWKPPALSDMRNYDEFKKEVFPKEGERYFIGKPIENEEILTRINTVIGNTN